jgi:hypothetical protein
LIRKFKKARESKSSTQSSTTTPTIGIFRETTTTGTLIDPTLEDEMIL